jgi:diguanylate cyclase (GGDEF)-like protein
MEPGFEAKHQELAGGPEGYGVASDSASVLAGMRLARRIILPVSWLLAAAIIAGGFLFYAQAGRNDDRLETERREALHAGAEKFRLMSPREDEIDDSTLRVLQQISGVKNLRWETEPQQAGREVQSVLDNNGRILGWFTWDPDRPMTQAATRLLYLLAVVAAGLIGIGGLSLWLTRRVTRQLADGAERARLLSRRDALTGLLNTGSILELLQQALADRGPDRVVTFVFIDLMRFRDLDDSLSRPWGNELLRAVSARVTGMLPRDATAGRLGRHKFAIIMQPESTSAGFRFSEEIADVISRPFRIQGQGVQLSGAVGVAHAPFDGLSAEELVRHATLAMRAARRTGRAVVHFDTSMEANLQERRFIERELKRALEENTLEIHYQPIVAAQDSRIVGVEALLRWNHPTRGNIPPMSFVPLAEQTGMMGQLGEFVLRRALEDAKRWPTLFVAVNLSPIQVNDRALFVLVSSMLGETGIEPSRVVLEITEGVLIDDPEEMRRRLEELRGLGVRLALDDFGSGYSSLSYLQHFPFDKLKIDGRFVAPLGRSANSGVIIQAIVALGRALGLSVLVEGIETEEQRVLLRLAGCDEMQGFLFAKAAPPDVIDQLLLENKLRKNSAAATQAAG